MSFDVGLFSCRVQFPPAVWALAPVNDAATMPSGKTANRLVDALHCGTNKSATWPKRKFSQQPFDHLIRSLKQYNYLSEYVRHNPEETGLSVGDYDRRHDS